MAPSYRPQATTVYNKGSLKTETTIVTLSTLESRCVTANNDEHLFTDPSLLEMIRSDLKHISQLKSLASDENNPHCINRG